MHTPTPWTYDRTFRALRGKQRGEVAYNLTCTDEDAALIVRAVNAHEELLDIIKEIYADENDLTRRKHSDEMRFRMEQAIANAEGLAEDK